MDVILLVVVIVLAIIVVGLIHFIFEMKQQLELLDREQHTQNTDIIKLIKEDNEIRVMLLQHIEILKYLVEQDPKLNSNKKIYFTGGPIGEA
jgi:flagellar basal body-associated protein FliL